MEFEKIDLKIPEGANIILGQSHFIKTVEDLHEAMVTSVPSSKFGIAFSEASGEKLVRHSGNDKELREIASENILAIGSGHCFIIIMKDCFPINVLGAIKQVPEICRIFCATANPTSVVVAREKNRGAILGVFDGDSPEGIEADASILKRKEFLRMIGYKL